MLLFALPDPASTPPPELPPFVESRVEIGIEDFEYQLADVDLDSRVDLLVTSVANGERMLRLWRQRADSSFPTAADWQLAAPPDVTAYSLLDVRSEPGREVILMTRSGLYSLTTTRDGLQGNLHRELTAALFPDLPDPQRLPCWRLTLDVDGDGDGIGGSDGVGSSGDELCVVDGTSLSVLSVVAAADGTTKLVSRNSWRCREPGPSVGKGSISFGGGGFRAARFGSAASYFAAARRSQPQPFVPPLLERRKRFDLPRLFDFCGDSSLEIVEDSGDGWQVSAAAVLPLDAVTSPIPNPTAHVTLPPAARDSAASHWIDADGDRQRELIVFDTSGDDKIALLFKASPDPASPMGALIEQTPSARVKLGGMSVEYALHDIDHDGRIDLTARTLEVPTGLSTLATVRLDMAFHVFRGQPGPTWSKAPDFSWERTFRPEQLGRVQESLLINLGGDFDGDGVNDLVTTQLDGRVEIRRVTKGEPLELEKRPVVSFEPPAPVDRLETFDLNLDRVADLMLRHERALTLFVSRVGGSGR